MMSFLDITQDEIDEMLEDALSNEEPGLAEYTQYKRRRMGQSWYK